MLTPEEYLRNDGPNIAWLYGLDVVEHVLKGDTEATVYRDRHPEPPIRMEELRQGMERGSSAEIYDEVLEDVFFQRARSREIPSEMGDLVIERYLDRDQLCFDEVVRSPSDKLAISILIEMSIPWIDRDSDDMIERHRKTYAIAAKAEAEGQPCRVIGAYATRIPERPGKTMRFYIVLKDFLDPIFPGLWGPLQTNLSTNALVNCVADYLIGTKSRGNGIVARWNIAHDFPEDEELIILNHRYLTVQR